MIIPEIYPNNRKCCLVIIHLWPATYMYNVQLIKQRQINVFVILDFVLVSLY